MAAAKGKMAKRVGIVLAVVAITIIAACAWYVNDSSDADESALAAIAGEGAYGADGVEVRELSGGALAFVPSEPAAGLVLYPGAKVQPEAYAPLMRKLAERGVTSIVVRPPFNLALLDVDAAGRACGQFPAIDTWVIAGHSMGGVAACDYVSRHQDEIDALVLLAAYPAADLSGYGGAVLSLSGSEDGVLNREKAEAAKGLLPAQTQELVIEGGNHANYANFGAQANDRPATISREQQQEQTVDAVMGLLKAA